MYLFLPDIFSEGRRVERRVDTREIRRVDGPTPNCRLPVPRSRATEPPPVPRTEGLNDPLTD